MRLRAVLTRALLLAGVLAVTGSAWASDSSDAPITDGETVRMMRGETIERTQTLDRSGRHYVGGVTYTVLESTADDLERIFENVPSYETILPHTKEARLVAKTADDLFVELHQGNALVDATYTIRLRKDPGARTVRFWLDPRRRHDIEDAWGFFRVEPLAEVTPGVPRVLLSYGILVDVGPGIVRALFETKIRDAMLAVPQRLRSYVARTVREPTPPAALARRP